MHTNTYYTSPSLGKFLLENKTDLCGIIWSNQHNYSKELVNTQLNKGDAAFFLCEKTKMVGCKYRAPKDKANRKQKVVHTLQTCHQPDMTDITIGGQPGRKPICVKYYTHHMGGVNKVYQQLHYQHTLRKSYKWYCKLTLWLISQVILNADKVYLAHTGSNTVFLDFMCNMIASLLASTPKIIIPNVQIPDDTHARLTGRHFPQVKKAAPDASDQKPTKQCCVCDVRGLRTNKGKPLKTIHICDMRHGCTQITVLECIIQCLTILGNDFPFYSFNDFQHTNIPEHTGMLKTIT